eukprot:gnl/TRDRNA2_/TRDRNA2_177576_c0_seq1.p1 gnl/TRDRNA2_/TRDRNA2_177576_c0~~gnl/TRDRNA2_/TRDRNA2_177576_c0_seq1.p1  ORF type:complete len:636 (-),score=14.38 gnl/TRDRNA2_/TRDRNA2_177576_c0_seq1:929-2836(-)
MDVKIMFSSAGAKTKEKVKLDYCTMPIPKGYVAGLGRGVTGFVTRSDIGPGTYLAGEMEEHKYTTEDKALDDESTNFDTFMGSDAGVFAHTGIYEDDDREADAIWDAVDEFMDQRIYDNYGNASNIKTRSSSGENTLLDREFVDLKKKLALISPEEWAAIPEIDCHIKPKNSHRSSLLNLEHYDIKNIPNKKTNVPNIVNDGTVTTDLAAIGEGRGTLLNLKLDKMADSVTSHTVVDPRGYMTELKSIKINTDTEISDIKKARLVLRSVTQTNLSHAPGWIASARIEELAGKLLSARQIILHGVENCPKNEEVWIEAARLQNLNVAKDLIDLGVVILPKSVNLWLQAAKLHHDPAKKSAVLRKAVEKNPDSVVLWKNMIDLANEEEARILFSYAVNCCPRNVELWIALARLETYETARKVLNRAREVIPNDPQIWLTASKLEESHGNHRIVEKIIERGVNSLKAHNVFIDREYWLKEAETSEKLKPSLVFTCRAIVKIVFDLEIDNKDNITTWLNDARESLSRNAIETARAIYKYALSKFPSKKSIWRNSAKLEKEYGTRETLDNLLKEGVRCCPGATVLWLMAAKEQWISGNINAAREYLAEGFRLNGACEEIWIAAYKIEYEAGELHRAKKTA